MSDNFKYQYQYPHPAVTTDCVIFSFDGQQLNVLLIERGIEPYKGKWALPGGFVRMDESLEACARRELEEETGIANCFMEQFHTFSDPDRDPRERVITTAFYALVHQQEVTGGDDAARAQWFPLEQVPQLAFDHSAILSQAVTRLRRSIHFKPIGFELLPEEFSMTELQRLYEAILSVQFDRRNFAKKMLHLGLVESCEPSVKAPAPRHRAQLFRFNRKKYDELKHRGFRLEF